MKKDFRRLCSLLFLCLLPGSLTAGELPLETTFANPPEAARPWVFWYWMEASVSREGIRADLEAMAEAGIAGAYLMPVKGPADPPLMDPVVQLSPEWWEMVKYSFAEADRLGLKLTLHACDGFAVAGGPWITPPLSMQKVVWTETRVRGGNRLQIRLPQPETIAGYYRDIALYAIPAPAGAGVTTETTKPRVTTSNPGEAADFLTDPDADEAFRARESPAWIEYAFEEPFLVRSIEIVPGGTNFQAKRLLLEASDDGEIFYPVREMQPPRHGWQDGDAPLTYSIPTTKARYFRFTYDPAGSEPGAEDLDSAKWRPRLSVKTITLSGTPRISQYEGKSGLVWRISPAAAGRDLPDFLCIDRSRMDNLSSLMRADGSLEWEAPEGDWILLRMGHTSTGKENYIGGGGRGLEADKLNPEAVTLQYDQWFGEAIRQIGPGLAERVLHGFHVDSWECGSQNWSPVFRQAFIEQHGYEPLEWLPAMAGWPLDSAGDSETFLRDVRETISSLLQESFFGTLKDLVEAEGCVFSAESVAPTMLSDGMLHYGEVDLPMGEFWLRSPTHDKPSDILDAIHGGHVYGRRIIQAEAFTQLRMAWDEHPGNLKALGDRNLARGINRFVFHVFTHNPWLDRVPGMTLDGVGLYFQRDQVWWEPGRAWMDYLARCQALLQTGIHRADIAVYTGDGLPRRAVLPDRLIGVLPGLIGEDRVEAVLRRLANEGWAEREEPAGVHFSANMEDPADWNDPLRGYAYDSVNQDALLRLASVEDGKVVFPGGARYSLLVLPGPRRMAPEGNLFKAATLQRLYQLVHDGATVLMETAPAVLPGFGETTPPPETSWILDRLWGPEPVASIGKGRVLRGPWREDALHSIGLDPAFRAKDESGRPVRNLSWQERDLGGGKLFFIANPDPSPRTLYAEFRVSGYRPEIWDPVTGTARPVPAWAIDGDRTGVQFSLGPAESLFVIFRKRTDRTGGESTPVVFREVLKVDGPWSAQFDTALGGPAGPVSFTRLQDWSSHTDPAIRHYSGKAVYKTTFDWPGRERAPETLLFLDLGGVANVAAVRLNGEACGVVWTEPLRLEITDLLKTGVNDLRIDVYNTWANRLIGDHRGASGEPVTWTRAPYRLGDGPLLPAGLTGPVRILEQADTD